MAGLDEAQTSNPFQHLQNELTTDQWTNLQLLRETGMVVDSEEDEDDEDTEMATFSVNNSPEHEYIIEYDVGDESNLQLGVVHDGESQTKANVEDTADFNLFGVDKETTMKYLSGLITFEEFNAIMEKNKVEEEEEGDQEDEDRTIADDAAASSSKGKEDLGGKPKRRRGKRRGQSRLPKDLQGLMGEANLKFARGEHDEARKMCMEIVRLVPSAWEPFQTLSMLYEEQEDMEKTLQFSLIAAHLSPQDAEEWVRLAEMSIEQGHVNQAVMCYSNAIRCDRRNLSLHWERCGLYESLGEKKKVLECYHDILKVLAATGEKKEYFKMARDVTKVYNGNKEVQKAAETISKAMKLYPEEVTNEDINLVVDLQIYMHQYDKAFEILLTHCGISISNHSDIELSVQAALENLRLSSTISETQTADQLTAVAKCHILESIPIDLRVKLVVCLIHLKQKVLVPDLLAPLFTESPENMGDLYLDVAEAYMETGSYAEAKPLFVSLVQTPDFNQAAVWLKYGECLNSLGEIQNAAKAFQKVVELAPSHLGARVSLSALQQQLGLHDEALLTLQQDEDQMPVDADTISAEDMKLMFHRSILLHSHRRYDEFIDISKQVLFSHMKDIFDKKYLSYVLNKKSIKHRCVALRHILGTTFEDHVKTAATLQGEHSVTIDDLWDLYVKLCNILISLKRFKEFQDVSILAITCPQFMIDERKIVNAEFICLLACILNKNGHFAYNLIKEICVQDIDNNRAWNLFCQIITMSQDIRHNRFCLRLMIKNPEHLALSILNGHNAMVAGSYKHGLGEYVAAFRQDLENPLLSLCIGITFIHLASQKYASKRHSLIIQACSFLNQYLELRGECQESYYNLGRAMHQIGLLHAAVFYYQKALTFEPAVRGEEEDIFDLRYEISYNLSLIYQASGSKELASMLIQQYCVV